MRALSDILAQQDGGSRMSGWLFGAAIISAGLFGAVMAIDGLISDKQNWWMGVPLAVLGLAEGIKFARYWRRSDAR